MKIIAYNFNQLFLNDGIATTGTLTVMITLEQTGANTTFQTNCNHSEIPDKLIELDQLFKIGWSCY